MTPYYDAAGITIYHGDCREILPGQSMNDTPVPPEAAIASLRAERDAWRDALFASNDLLRSAYSVAQREGKNTNWGPLQSRLYDGLQTQHRLMYPPTEAQP